jgi:hypothetical protein
LDFIPDEKENMITKLEKRIPKLIQIRIEIWVIIHIPRYEGMPAIQVKKIKLNQNNPNKLIDLIIPRNCEVLLFKI